MLVPCTGPVRLWVTFPDNIATPQPLGTCERAPEIVEAPEYEEVMNDLGGTKKPFDLSFQGSDAIVAGVLTRYREGIIRALRNAPGFGFLPAFIGSIPGDIGTLMMTEGRFLTLHLEYLYGTGATAKPVMTADAMPAGLRFPGAIFRGPTRHSVGTGSKKMQILFYCARVYAPATGNMVCCDENMAAIAGLPWEVNP